MTALAALNRAREAWERTSPQLIFDFEYGRSLREAAPTPSPEPPPGAVSQSDRSLTPGAEPGRVPPPRDGQPPVRDTAAPTGASAPPTPAEEQAVAASASDALRVGSPHSESSASAGLPLAPNGPGRKSPKTQRGQGQKGA